MSSAGLARYYEIKVGAAEERLHAILTDFAELMEAVPPLESVLVEVIDLLEEVYAEDPNDILHEQHVLSHALWQLSRSREGTRERPSVDRLRYALYTAGITTVSELRRRRDESTLGDVYDIGPKLLELCDELLRIIDVEAAR